MVLLGGITRQTPNRRPRVCPQAEVAVATRLDVHQQHRCLQLGITRMGAGPRLPWVAQQLHSPTQHERRSGKRRRIMAYFSHIY
jgi:hypothetical protein